MFNADVANLTLSGTTASPTIPQRRRDIPDELSREGDLVDFGSGVTTPVFLNEEERKRSISVVGKSVRVISRSLTADTNTNISVTGNQSGAQFTLPITVKADPSRI